MNAIPWLFVSVVDRSSLIQYLAAIRGKSLIIADTSCPRDWHREIPGTALCIDNCEGDYNGIIAFDSLVGEFERSMQKSRSDVLASLRRKHPDWTDSKVNRAAEQQFSHQPFDVVRAHANARGQEELSIFSSMAIHFGQLRLIVTDDDFNVGDFGRERTSVDALTIDVLMRLRRNTMLCVDGCARSARFGR